MYEMALRSSRYARRGAPGGHGEKPRGRRGAGRAAGCWRTPTRFLSTVQVGITSIGILNGIIGEAAFSAVLAQWLRSHGMPDKPSEIAATAIVVAVITYVTIIFGELVPKRIGQLYPEQVARWVARPHGLAGQGGRALRQAAVGLHAGRAQAAGDRHHHAARHDRGEIAHSLEEGVDAGVIEQHEHQMVRNVFHLDDRPLTSMMVPRSDIQWIDASLRCARRCARRQRPAALLVPGVPRLARRRGRRGERGAPAGLGPRTKARWSRSGAGALRARDADRHGAAGAVPHAGRPLVFVVDEYGVVQGLITPHDLLEAITGELQPRRRPRPGPRSATTAPGCSMA
jgi:putative hemolysin